MRAIRLEDNKPLPPRPTKWEQIRVSVCVVHTQSTGGGTCFPESFDDVETVSQKIGWVAEDMPGEYVGFSLQVHLQLHGIVVWAQGDEDEVYQDVAERAERIWLAAKRAWQDEHKNIL